MSLAALSEQHFDNLRVTAYLPKEIRSFTYVKNHHYIELEDEDGNKIKLIAKSMVKGVCQGCAGEVFVESNIGNMACPHCQHSVEWVWGKAQLSFVPESEYKFVSTAIFPTIRSVPPEKINESD